MDERYGWMDGWRNVDLDDHRRTGGRPAGRFDYEGVSEIVVDSRTASGEDS